MKLLKLKAAKQYILSLRIPERLKVLLRPWPKVRNLVSTWPRLIAVLAVGFIVLYYPLGAIITENIDTSTDYNIQKENNRSSTIDTLSFIIHREVYVNSWTPALPFIFPSSLLDNMPSFQLGLISSVSNIANSLSKQQTQITSADNPLVTAAELLRYPGNIWMFSPTNKLIPVPSSNSQYRRARRHLKDYNKILSSGGAVFNTSAAGLQFILKNIHKDLTKTLSLLETHIREHSSDIFDTRSDDTFFYTKGKLYGYHLLLSALMADYKDTIVKHNTYQTFTIIQKALENAFSISPLIVRNASLDSSFSPNHLANVGFYTSKASANITKAIKKLSQTNIQGKNQ